MNITGFNIDAINKTVSIAGHDPASGIFVNISGMKLVGHEGKTVHEVEAHARSEARRILAAMAQKI